MRGIGAVFIFLLLTVSCIEIYELEFPLRKDIIMVEALLLDNPEYQYVRLYRTDSGRARIPVYGAEVNLHDNEGAVWRLSSLGEGVFGLPNDTIELQADRQYQLEVSMGDSIHILSTWENVPPPIDAKALTLEAKYRNQITDDGFVVAQKGVELFASSAELPAGEVYLRWTYDMAWGYIAPQASDLCSPCWSCIILEHSSRTLVASALNSAGKSLDNLPFDFIPVDERFNVRFSIRLKQFSITKRAYEFYEVIQQQETTKGNIFDPPPAVVTGNLVDQLNPRRTIYGLFEVGRYSETSASITKSEMPFIVPPFLDRCRDGTAPGCSDCRQREGFIPYRPYFY